MEVSGFALFMLVFGLAVGGLLGWLLTWLYAQGQRAQLEARGEADAEKIEWIKDSQQILRDAFEALASKSLRENARDFSGRINQNLTSHAQHIDLLKVALEKNINQNLASHAQHIGVLKVTLEKNITQLDGEIRVLEQKREGAYQEGVPSVVEN
jgi:hypothetical protein